MNLSSQVKNIINIDRAIQDLKAGLCVRLKHNKSEKVFFAAETMNFDMINCEIDLIISKRRAEFLFDRSKNTKIVIHSTDQITSHQIIYSISKDIDICNNKFLDINILEQYSLKLLKLANLIPISVCFSNEKFDDSCFSEINIININKKEISDYTEICNINVKKVCETELNIKYADNVKIIGFRTEFSQKEFFAIIIGKLSTVPILRIHSSCYTGDLIGSLSCDCGDQLSESIKYMSKHVNQGGIIIYLMQEGRGIGLINKLRSYNIQHNKIDTVDANRIIGFEDDERDFGVVPKILEILNISQVKLITNNPKKINLMKKYNVDIKEIISIYTKRQKYNESYLNTKANRLGHLL